MADEETLEKFELNLEDLDSGLVFTRFGELAKKRDDLYSDYIEIDEPDEIGDTWVEFSGEVVKDLLSVIDLTKSLFERLIDELRRNQNEPSKEDLNRVRNLTEFWLDLSIMSYLYATIEKRGVLNQKGKEEYSLGYINTKKSLDELTLLAFQAGQEFFSLDSRITLGEALSLNMEKKRLDFLDDIKDVEELKYQILGDYDKNQAMFLMGRVFDRLINSSHSWWFLDPIGLHSASEHAITHLVSMKEYWGKCTSDLVEKGITFYETNFPLFKTSSQVALAQHYKRLAMAALETRANSTASEYFGKAASLTLSLGIENLGKSENRDVWEPTMPEQNLIYTQMMHLSIISAKYTSIMKYLKEDRKEEILVLIPEILDKISKMLSEGDIAYVSSVAVTYETVFVYLKEQLENGGPYDQILSFIKNRIQTTGDRLHKASHQIAKNWIKVVHADPSNVEIMNEIIANIDYPLMALFILPPSFKLVESASAELIVLKLVTEALTISAGAEKEFGSNPVKEMLMRAKTFELTHHAKRYIGLMEDDETIVAVKDMLQPVSQNAFLRGLIAEIQLRTAVLQFRYINRIAPLIENSALASANVSKSQIDKEELVSFTESLLDLHRAATEVNKYQAPITIGGAPLNWGYINKMEFYSLGLVEIVKSVNNAIQAANASETSEVEDAITYWDQAKTLAFNAAEIVAKAKSQESENLAQQVYSLAQIYYEFEGKKRNRKPVGKFPIEGIVELMSSLVMGL